MVKEKKRMFCVVCGGAFFTVKLSRHEEYFRSEMARAKIDADYLQRFATQYVMWRVEEGPSQFQTHTHRHGWWTSPDRRIHTHTHARIWHKDGEERNDKERGTSFRSSDLACSGTALCHMYLSIHVSMCVCASVYLCECVCTPAVRNMEDRLLSNAFTAAMLNVDTSISGRSDLWMCLRSYLNFNPWCASAFQQRYVQYYSQRKCICKGKCISMGFLLFNSFIWKRCVDSHDSHAVVPNYLAIRLSVCHNMTE